MGGPWGESRPRAGSKWPELPPWATRVGNLNRILARIPPMGHPAGESGPRSQPAWPELPSWATRGGNLDRARAVIDSNSSRGVCGSNSSHRPRTRVLRRSFIQRLVNPGAPTVPHYLRTCLFLFFPKPLFRNSHSPVHPLGDTFYRHHHLLRIH